MLRTFIYGITLLAVLNGCATYHNDSLERMRTLPQHFSQFDAKLAWEIRTADNSTVIEGIIQNIRFFEMDELEVWVSSLDSNGKVMYRSADYVYRLKENEVAPFTLKIPQAAAGTKLRFTYSYIGHGGGGESGDALSWRQSFESEVP